MSRVVHISKSAKGDSYFRTWDNWKVGDNANNGVNFDGFRVTFGLMYYILLSSVQIADGVCGESMNLSVPRFQSGFNSR